MNDTDKDENPGRRPDVMTYVILLSIWCVGVFFVKKYSPAIPNSMLAIGTLFFAVLIPAMSELVRAIERAIDREVSGKRD